MVAEHSLYRQLLKKRQDLYNRSIDEGLYSPFIYPWDTIPAAALLMGVIVTPRLPRKLQFTCRVLLTIASICYCLARWGKVRTIGMAGGYGLGLASTWGMIMTVVLLVLHDPARDFRRLEIRLSTLEPSSDTHVNGSSHLSPHSSVDLRQRKVHSMNSTLALPEKGNDQIATKPYRLVWSGYPKQLLHLLDWTFDLVTSFRGINWNWRIATTPRLDAPYPEPPASNESQKLVTSRVTGVPVSSMQQLTRQSILDTVLWYLYIDLFKTFMVTDPYFLGIAPLDAPTPWAWLSRLNETVPIATKAFRLGISMAAIIGALTLIFSLAPLFFGVILPALLGGSLFAMTKSPLLEPGMYAPQWGPMWHSLSTKGLRGFWGSWWHQMFRYGISEPAKAVVKHWGIEAKGQAGILIQLFIAFALTGTLHYAGASTSFSIVPAKPWNPFMFFVLQAAGILMQTTIADQIRRMITLPTTLRQVGNVGFIVIWAWFTGPLLADDFARCNIWLFEPNPISLFRGLGFGPGDTWVPWLNFPQGGRWFGWWDGGQWYNSGIAIY